MTEPLLFAPPFLPSRWSRNGGATCTPNSTTPNSQTTPNPINAQLPTSKSSDRASRLAPRASNARRGLVLYCRGSYPLRSVADYRGGDRACVRGAAAARVDDGGGVARGARAGAVAAVGARGVPREQQGERRGVVCIRRILRRGEPGAGASVDRVDADLEVWDCSPAGVPWLAVVSAIAVASSALVRRNSPERGPIAPRLIVVLALAASAALPLYAYYQDTGAHPLRGTTGRGVGGLIGSAVALLPRRLGAAPASSSSRSRDGSTSFDRQARSCSSPARCEERRGGRAVTAYLAANWAVTRS